MRVDRDSVSIRLDADGLEADVANPRPPARGDQQPVAAQLTSVVDLEHVVIAIATGGRRVGRQDELDALAAENLAQRLTQRRRLAAEHVLGHVNDHCLAAEPAHRLRHLHSDRPGAQDEQPTRNGLHRGHLAVGPDALELA